MQTLVNLPLLDVVVEFAPFLAQQEIEVYLTVVVGQRTLFGMENETRQGTEREAPGAPLHICARDVLIPKAEHDGEIDGEEPQVAREAVEHTSDEGLLTRQTRHLTIGGVAEVGKHQQQYATDVMPQVGIVKHKPSPHSQEDRNDSDDIGVDIELIPQQGER